MSSVECLWHRHEATMFCMNCGICQTCTFFSDNREYDEMRGCYIDFSIFVCRNCGELITVREETCLVRARNI